MNDQDNGDSHSCSQGSEAESLTCGSLASGAEDLVRELRGRKVTGIGDHLCEHTEGELILGGL